MPKDTNFKQNLCADMQGLSLHAAVRCGADDRQVLEQLCRNIAWPSLADEWPVCGGQIHWLYLCSGSDALSDDWLLPESALQRPLFGNELGS